MGKGYQKLFKAVFNAILKALPILGESGSEVSYFILEPRNFAEVIRLSEDINKSWTKETMKEIKYIINNRSVLVKEPEKVEPVTPCMDIYKAKIQSDGSLDKLKFRIVVIGDMQNQ